MIYDSSLDTLKHIGTVRNFIQSIRDELQERAVHHDASKLEDPELEIFNIYIPKLKNRTYGSDEYKQYLKEMNVALDHHYANNRHHPEHYPNGIRDMSLVDLVEMLCDWLAATKRHDDGDIRRSIELNQERFGYSDELKQILYNTLEFLE
jgi:hypothetical protein